MQDVFNSFSVSNFSGKQWNSILEGQHLFCNIKVGHINESECENVY